jgi:hypothetical protein
VKFLIAAALALLSHTAAAQLLLSANDNKVLLENGRVRTLREPKPDTLSIIDIGANPPVMKAEIPVPASVVGPPNAIAITPDARLALVVASQRPDPAEPGDDVGREQRLHLEEVRVVDHVLDHGVHVVGLVGRVGDECVELTIGVADAQVDRHLVGRRLVEVVHCREVVDVELAPGDAFLCHNFTVHRSGTNSTDAARRGFSVNFVDARTRVLDPRPALAGSLGTPGKGFPVVFDSPFA